MKNKTTIRDLFTRIGNVLIILAMLLSLVSIDMTEAAPSINALQLNGTSAYVAFGTTGRDYLGAATFTLELWFKRTAAGGGTVSTGTGGVTAYPLLTKGMGEADGDRRDCNYFLGIRSSDNVLVADFEDSTNGLNHPVAGVTVLPASENVWHHAAATYNGTKWQLFLDGKLEADLNVGKTPRADSIQYAALGTAMTSLSQNPNGYFIGVLDEARIWNYARSQAEILSSMNVEITSPDNTKLLGYWRMNDGSGTTLGDSSGRAVLVPGTIYNATWVPDAGFPINSDTTAPAAPLNLGAIAGDAMVTLSWQVPADTDLRGYNVYRSTSTPVPLSNPINGNILVPGTSYIDGGLTNGTTYYYAITAVDSSANASGGSLEANATPASNPTHYALQFNGTDQYVTFGRASRLGVEMFTIEGWFKRIGTGSTTTTGTGGITAEPLITKGRDDGTDNRTNDLNYFIGIRPADGFLVADFEDTAGSGTNHPIVGTSSVADSNWHHVAFTYDGAGGNIKLYLDGTQQGLTITLSKILPRADSIEHAALGTALNSTGTPAGFFNGALDEVRIWSYARSATEISNNKNVEVLAAPGLLGRWGLNEGTGAQINDTSGLGINGTAVGSPVWVTDTPFGAPPTPPAAPSGLSLTAPTHGQVHLTWTDNANNETSFELERSTTGVGGIYSLQTTLPANTITYDDLNLNPSSEYCYRVRAVNGAGASGYAGPLCITTPVEGSNGLYFNGSDDYVTFGRAPELDAQSFTVETWFKRTGTGVAVSTGTNGVSAVPLVTKGSPENDGSNVDENYILGIRSSDNVLAGDFEIYQACNGRPAGDNNPIVGVTPIANNTWNHAAFTYDGTALRLYLNGNLEATLANTCLPRYDSIQHAGLGTYLTSSGGSSGFFNGVLDEVRIWNVARSETEILSTINSQITDSPSGLLARWGLNEGSGSFVNEAGGSGNVYGRIIGTGWSWVTPGAPFNIPPPSPPVAPSNLTATLAPGSQIDLAWTDGSSNETNFQVEYALDPPTCSIWSSLGTSGANTPSFRHWNTTVNTQYCYRVRAANGGGTSPWSNTVTAWTPPSYSALSFGRDHAFVKFPNSSSLNTPTFTVETWFRREGPGVGVTTGSGGVTSAIPLVAKGTSEAENAGADINYFLGIDASTAKLVADFEEGQAGASPSLNHPVYGTNAIANGVWYHAVATYDGTQWVLYLNGSVEATLNVGQPANAVNTAPVSLGTSIQSGGNTAQGFFDGSLDEVRIWNYARSQTEVRSTMNQQIDTATTGLLARWSLDEGSGTTVNGSAGTAVNGGIYPASPTGWNWSVDAPFNATLRPDLPTVVQPVDGANGVTRDPAVNLVATVNDPDTSSLTVNFYGRPACSTAPNFTLAVVPDTQYYSSQTNGGTLAMFDAETQWIADNKTARKIVYTTHLGDIVDTYSDTTQWNRANEALTRLETGTVAYGLAVGNHDGAPGNTGNFNSFFPFTRFGNGHYLSDNDNNFGLFSSGGMDFIIIHIEYSADAATRAWANDLLSVQYPTRRAIVVTHNLLSGITSPAPFSAEGQALYDALKANPNLFLMLGGHLDTEVSRTDTYNGHTVYSLRSDYQFRTGGNGWLRLVEFQPAANQIQVYTYSPFLDQWETDADSQFTLPYAMGGTACDPWQLISTNTGVASGSSTTAAWNGLSQNTGYQWYVTVNDGTYTVSSPTWSFTTAASATLNLQASWNLVTLPLQPVSPYNAETWLLAINAQGGTCSEVDQWVNGVWLSHPLGAPYGLFDINLGTGYFVQCDQPNTWIQQGIRPTSGVPISLSPGFNLMGFPYTQTAYTAQTLLGAITIQGGACSEIHRWINGIWESYIIGLPFNNFNILPAEGYFLKCSVSSNFTP